MLVSGLGHVMFGAHVLAAPKHFQDFYFEPVSPGTASRLAAPPPRAGPLARACIIAPGGEGAQLHHCNKRVAHRCAASSCPKPKPKPKPKRAPETCRVFLTTRPHGAGLATCWPGKQAIVRLRVAACMQWGWHWTRAAHVCLHHHALLCSKAVTDVALSVSDTNKVGLPSGQ